MKRKIADPLKETRQVKLMVTKAWRFPDGRAGYDKGEKLTFDADKVRLSPQGLFVSDFNGPERSRSDPT